MGVGNVFVIMIVGIICIAVIMCIFMVLVGKTSKKNMEQFQKTSQQMFNTVQNMQQTQKKQTEPKKCPYCGAVNPAGSLRCASCDSPLG